MAVHANLISGSILVMETIDYLVSVGGSAGASSVVEYVMNIRNANDAMSRALVGDLSERDPRISVDGDCLKLCAKLLFVIDEPVEVGTQFDTLGVETAEVATALPDHPVTLLLTEQADIDVKSVGDVENRLYTAKDGMAGVEIRRNFEIGIPADPARAFSRA